MGGNIIVPEFFPSLVMFPPAVISAPDGVFIIIIIGEGVGEAVTSDVRDSGWGTTLTVGVLPLSLPGDGRGDGTAALAVPPPPAEGVEEAAKEGEVAVSTGAAEKDEH